MEILWPRTRVRGLSTNSRSWPPELSYDAARLLLSLMRVHDHLEPSDDVGHGARALARIAAYALHHQVRQRLGHGWNQLVRRSHLIVQQEARAVTSRGLAHRVERGDLLARQCPVHRRAQVVDVR